MSHQSLYLVRGLPGSGKSALAKTIAGEFSYAADDFFYDLGQGSYAFDPSKLSDAHSLCQTRVETALKGGIRSVAVANTFTQSWEAEVYFKMADKYGYSVFIIECQNSFGNVHGVPPEAIERMEARWEPKLRRPNG